MFRIMELRDALLFFVCFTRFNFEAAQLTVLPGKVVTRLKITKKSNCPKKNFAYILPTILRTDNKNGTCLDVMTSKFQKINWVTI